jgi:hypothetical protein
VARCERILGRLALAAGNAAMAGEHLTEAAAFFRDGDYLIELAETLVGVADHARTVGTWMAPITMPPRRSPSPPPAAWCPLIPPRWPPAPRSTPSKPPPARPCWAKAATPLTPALRVAARYQLAWHELDALRAHAALDQAEGTDHGWAAQAEALHARLVLPGLHPDPLAMVQRRAAARFRSERVPDDLKEKKKRRRE